MRTWWRGGLTGLTIGLTGCVGDGSADKPWAFRNPFQTEQSFDVAKAPTASVKAATRVHAIGSDVAAANAADLSAKPVFLTIGLPEPMLFHQGSGQVVISEGLVERCRTDAELAAVLSHELGKLAANKPAKAAPRPERDLPPDVPLSADVVGAGYTQADMTRVAEEAMADRRGARPARSGRDSRPDPKALAQDFYVKAGHNADGYARMASLIREAEDNAEKREIMRGR